MTLSRKQVIDKLLKSEEPSIRWKVRVRVLGEDPESHAIQALREEIRTSPRVKSLLSVRDSKTASAWKVYAKWQGPHWILSSLAEIGYPAGDESLMPVCNRVLEHWLGEMFYKEFEINRAIPKSRQDEGVPKIRGRYRRCASQQGNALLSLTLLGLADEPRTRLVERLLHWQWPDGGWNCDRNPSADTSSFNETLLPMRGLAAYADATGDETARKAALRASEVFLSRRIFKRRSDGKVIHPNFSMLHYPLYWHYDILGGLKAMAEMGLARDSRCDEALELLERKELPNGGWASEGKFYNFAKNAHPGSVYGSREIVGWGSSGRTRMNEWATADALFVLKSADRL